MSEVQFAKTFLALLDRKAIKLNSDYVSDPKKYPSQSPYILPKPSNPFPRKAADAASTAVPPTITVTLKPMKGPSEAITLPAQEPNTSILDIKIQYAQKSGQDAGKIKLLYNKRPASDLKALRELLPQPTPDTAELSVMILGGGAGSSLEAASSIDRSSSPAIQLPDPTAVPIKRPAAETPASSEQESTMQDVVYSSAETNTADELRSDGFWADLQGFLVQRLRDETEGKRVVAMFREAARS